MADSKKTIEVQTNSIPDPVDSNRRRAVKAIVGGVSALAVYNAMPTRWSKPFIEQVFLPAHAATSGTSLNDPCTVTVLSGTTVSGSVDIQVDGFVEPAVPGLAATIVVTPAGAGSPTTLSTTTLANGTFLVTTTITGGPGITSVSAVTSVVGATGTANCSATVPPPSTTTAAPSTSPLPE